MHCFTGRKMGKLKQLGEPAPAEFAQRLRARGVPVAVGRVIVATVEPHENVVLHTIKETGLELELRYFINRAGLIAVRDEFRKEGKTAEAQVFAKMVAERYGDMKPARQ